MHDQSVLRPPFLYLGDLSPGNEAAGKEGVKLHSVAGRFRSSVAEVHHIDAVGEQERAEHAEPPPVSCCCKCEG